MDIDIGHTDLHFTIGVRLSYSVIPKQYPMYIANPLCSVEIRGKITEPFNIDQHKIWVTAFC